MKNMRKVLFLLLFLLVLGAAGTNAQVRIGGDEAPNEVTILDLNTDDDTNDGTKGLALPRVQLESDDAKLDGVTKNLDGMLVYNTGGSLSAGVYFWNGTNWIIGLTDTIPGGGLDNTGDGKVGIKTGGVTSAMILDGTITAADIANNAVTTAKIADKAVTMAKIATESTDNNKYLVSNGSTAYWRDIPWTRTQQVPGGSLLPTKPTVTWTKVFDSPVTFPTGIPSGCVVLVDVVGLSPADICHTTSAATLVIAGTNGFQVIRIMTTDIAPGSTLTVRCYRPT